MYDHRPIEQRYKVAENGCWIFDGGKTPDGYGYVRFKGPGRQAHRVFYEIFIGTIPEHMCVLHTCDNRPCVNPQHLFLGTRGDNNKDRNNKNRTAVGEKISSTFTEDDIRYILKSPLGARILAEIFEVNPSSITRIKQRKNWKHVKL